jgi:hypothetical protein
MFAGRFESTRSTMLEARAAKHDASFWRMRRDVRCDIYDAQGKIGALVYDAKSESATLDVRGRAFTAARERKREREVPWQFVLRKLSGREKPPANPVLLKDANGAVLARAESKGGAGWLVARGDEAFELRRRSLISGFYDLYRQGQSQALGAVGAGELRAPLQVDLPNEFDEIFQVFVIALHTDMKVVAANDDGGASGG